MRHDEQQPSSPEPGPTAGATARRVWGQSFSIAAATMPFGVAFGVAASQAGLALWQTCAFSLAVFAGSAQFAAVSVLANGGGALSAIIAGLVLNLRSMAFGATVLSVLPRSRWRRALACHWVLDESTVVAASQPGPEAARLGFYATGGSVFVLWNIATVVGFTVVSNGGDLVSTLGIDVAFPAAFLALLWPRLAERSQRLIALAAVAIALVLTPIAPAGLVVIAAAGAVALDGELWRR